jgi:hypothetical protein
MENMEKIIYSKDYILIKKDNFGNWFGEVSLEVHNLGDN